ncbi:MAG TPA: hypothetical protein VE865_16125 [Bradyrhizobium sp.]|nr:hypothetical protein [Bradyrhizobium sp.]
MAGFLPVFAGFFFAVCFAALLAFLAAVFFAVSRGRAAFFFFTDLRAFLATV